MSTQLYCLAHGSGVLSLLINTEAEGDGPDRSQWRRTGPPQNQFLYKTIGNSSKPVSVLYNGSNSGFVKYCSRVKYPTIKSSKPISNKLLKFCFWHFFVNNSNYFQIKETLFYFDNYYIWMYYIFVQGYFQNEPTTLWIK